MARSATTQKVGRGPCPDCGETITFRRSSGGMLTHKCEACDSSGYAEPGGRTHAKRMAAMHPEAIPKGIEPAEPEGKPAPAPAPSPKRANSVFSLADL